MTSGKPLSGSPIIISGLPVKGSHFYRKNRKERHLKYIVCGFMSLMIAATATLFVSPGREEQPEQEVPEETAAVITAAPPRTVDEWSDAAKEARDQHVEIEYEMLFTDDDVAYAAKLMFGEAGCDWCTDFDRMCCLWTVLNRVDAWGGTIVGQITSANQFLGYNPKNAVKEHYVELAADVLTRWSLEKQGVKVVRELPSDFLWFSATPDGWCNVFRDTYERTQNTNYIRGDEPLANTKGE